MMPVTATGSARSTAVTSIPAVASVSATAGGASRASRAPAAAATTIASVSSSASVPSVPSVPSITPITSAAAATSAASTPSISTGDWNWNRLGTLIAASRRTSRSSPVTSTVVRTSAARLNDRLELTSAIGAFIARRAVDNIGWAFVPDVTWLRVWAGIGNGHASLDGLSGCRSRSSTWEGFIYDLGIVSLVQVVDGPSLDRGTSTGSLGPVGWITPLIAESVINLYNAVGDGPWGEVKTVTDTAVSTEADNVAV